MLEKGRYANEQPPAMYKVMIAQQVKIMRGNGGKSGNDSMSFGTVPGTDIGHVEHSQSSP